MYICKNCKSTNVEIHAWVNPNTLKVNDKVEDMYNDEEAEYCWCNDCDDHTTIMKMWELTSIN